VVDSLKLKTFNPNKYPNPALQWHYRVIQAVALEEDLPEKPEDKTIPKYSMIHKRVGEYALNWGEELNDEIPAGRVEPSPKKRKAVRAETADEDGDVKKVKREKKSVEPASSDKIESLYEQGNLMSVRSISRHCLP